ncbi:MAG: type I secretion system permease/ATPase [Hyphomicrobiaceae bacterium]
MKLPRDVDGPAPELRDTYDACRSALIGTMGFSCLINLLMFTGPLFMLQVYDRVLTSRSVPTLWALVALVVVLYIFMGLLELIRSRIMVRVGQRVAQYLSAPLFERVIRLGLHRGRAVDINPLGDLDTVKRFLSGPGPLALFDTPWVPIYLAVIFALHVWLGVLALLGAIVLFTLAYINQHWIHALTASAARSAVAERSFAEETRRNAEVVHAMGMVGSMRSRWQTLSEKAASEIDLTSDRSGTITSVTKVIRLFLQSAMLALGAYLAIGGEITPGVMIAASIIMSRALAPVEQSISHWRNFTGFRRALRRLQKVLTKVPIPTARMSLPVPNGHISVEKALIMAPGSTRPILQGLNFQLLPGESVGVIGPSGAGKSTMARALVGAWPVAAGAIRVDGAPIEQWRPEDLGSTIGYLPQDVELFAGTVEENISRFEPSTDPNKVISAAYRANVHEVILDLPQGYMTRLGEGGATLSAGQRQRIGLARALFGDPAFVVLDEPNAHLDTDGEAALASALATLRESGATVAIITHRPSAIKSVDYLLLLENGRQRAFGHRSVLLGEKGAGTISGTPIAPNNSGLAEVQPMQSRGRTLRRHQPARVPSEPAST